MPRVWSDGPHPSTIHIHRDATPPTVTVTPERAPDANGWYNHAVAFAYSGRRSDLGGRRL